MSLTAALGQDASSKAALEPSRKSKASLNAQCHDVISTLNVATAALKHGPELSVTNATSEQLESWSEEIDDCALQHPGELSTKDWQNAVMLSARLQQELYTALGNSNTQALGSGCGHIIMENSHEWETDYNELARKYNTLVSDYNKQRNLLLQLTTTPLSLPSAPSFVHCSTFNNGVIGSIDCY